jgi:hypothetical protein
MLLAIASALNITFLWECIHLPRWEPKLDVHTKRGQGLHGVVQLLAKGHLVWVPQTPSMSASRRIDTIVQ